MPWCSGYLICLTSRRSPVQAWVASVFLPFDIFCVFFTSPVKNKKPIKIFFDTRSFKQWIKTYRSSFQKKISVHTKITKHNLLFNFSLNQQPHEMTINNSHLQMRNDTQFQAFKPNITFQIVFSSVKGQRSKKIKQKKQKIRSINRTVFTTNVAQVLLRSTL